MRVFKDHSHSARRCYQLAREPDKIAELESFINSVITNPPPFSLIESTLLLLQSNIGDNATINHSSDVIAIEPNEDRKPILVIATRHICDHLCRGLKNRDAEKF